MIKYAIKLKNGQFASQEWDDSSFKYIKLHGHDSPVYAGFMNSEEIAKSVLSDILTGGTNFPVFYDEANPPVEVVALDINIKEII